jgi:hypothetical protein
MSNRRTLMLFGVVVLLSTLTFGCASVNTKPYTEYAQAVKSAQTGIDQAMTTSYTWTRETYLENFKGPFSELIIQPGKQYEWSMSKPPLFMTIKKAQQKLAQLNRSFADYADLLEALANKKVGDPEHFNDLTTEMNNNAKQAWQAFGAKPADKEVAIFSIGAVELSRIYLQNKQLAKLREAIQANQLAVEQYSEHCISLIHTIRATIKSNYPDQYLPVWKRWRKSTESQKKQVTTDMLEVNEQFLAALDMLAAVDRAYQHIPKAHQALAKTVDEVQFTFNRQSLERLVESGKRLQQMYKKYQEPK